MGVIGSVIGAGVNAIGSIAQGAAAAKEAQYQAAIARNNAVIARKNATYSLVKGQREEQSYRIRGAALISALRARFGASGAEVNIGSPVQVTSGAVMIQELDALTIRNNAAREAWNYEVEARNFEAQSELNEMQADNAMMSGVIGAASSLVQGVSSVSPKWGSWRSQTPYTPISYGPGTVSAPMAVPVVEQPPRNPGYMQPSSSQSYTTLAYR